MKWILYLAMSVLIASAAIAAPQQANPNLPVDAAALDQQMRALVLEREQTLNELAEQVSNAPLSERTLREEDYAATQVQYEIQLLELMVQYYELTGNTDLRERAAVNLAQLLAPLATGTPEPGVADRNRGSATTEGR